jgi:hypothetical protein
MTLIPKKLIRFWKIPGPGLITGHYLRISHIGSHDCRLDSVDIHADKRDVRTPWNIENV